jgi:hypothetical protein
MKSGGKQTHDPSTCPASRAGGGMTFFPFRFDLRNCVIQDDRLTH